MQERPRETALIWTAKGIFYTWCGLAVANSVGIFSAVIINYVLIRENYTIFEERLLADEEKLK